MRGRKLWLGWVVLGGVTFVWPWAGLVLIGAGMLICFVSGVWMLKIAFVLRPDYTVDIKTAYEPNDHVIQLYAEKSATIKK